MPTIREQLLDAIKAALNAAGKPAGLVVHGVKGEPFQDEPGIAISVSPEAEEHARSHESIHGPLMMHTLDVRLYLSAKNTIGAADAWKVGEPVLVWIWSQLMADADVHALVESVTPLGTAWVVETFDKQYVEADDRWRFYYPTLVEDLTAQP